MTALSATITLEPDMLSAPIAGLSVKPSGSSASPAIGSAMLLYPIAHARFCRILRRVPRPMAIAIATSSGSERISTTSAVSTATSVPAPIATPTSARASPGASLTPSTTIATLRPDGRPAKPPSCASSDSRPAKAFPGSGLSVGTLCLIAEPGHHAALGGVVEVVAVRHPLAGVGGVEVAGDLLAGADDHGVFARAGGAELERVPVDVHRVVHRGGVGEDHPDPLALGHEELQRAGAGHVEGLAVDAPVVAGHPAGQLQPAGHVRRPGRQPRRFRRAQHGVVRQRAVQLGRPDVSGRTPSPSVTCTS